MVCDYEGVKYDKERNCSSQEGSLLTRKAFIARTTAQSVLAMFAFYSISDSKLDSHQLKYHGIALVSPDGQLINVRLVCKHR